MNQRPPPSLRVENKIPRTLWGLASEGLLWHALTLACAGLLAYNGASTVVVVVVGVLLAVGWLNVLYLATKMGKGTEDQNPEDFV